MNKKISIHALIELAYIFLFVFFLTFSPIFYNIENQSFRFHFDSDTFLVLFAISLVLIVNVIGFLRKREDSMILNKAFSEYVSKDIADELLNQKGEINLKGERKKITIFFSDIEGFTSLSEHLRPEELLNFLKEYLLIMSSNIQKYNGFIDKYEGDCIMALWGAFHSMQKDSYNTCLSAIKQQKALKILNIRFKKHFGKEVRVRMGINTGDAILGNIGAAGKKVEYTALGDSVNIASRLEGVNKFYGTYVCVSEYVYNECIDFFEFREIDTVLLKGKDTGIRVYELLDEKGKVDAEYLSLMEQYERGLTFYYHGDYKKALAIFKKLEDIDPVSTVMKTRCQKFLKNPPLKSWNFVWRMEQK